MKHLCGYKLGEVLYTIELNSENNTVWSLVVKEKVKVAGASDFLSYKTEYRNRMRLPIGYCPFCGEKLEAVTLE